MPKGSGGGGRPGRNGGGGGDAGQPGEVIREANQAKKDAELGAKLDAAYLRISKRLNAIDSQYRALGKQSDNARSESKRQAILKQMEDLGKKTYTLTKQRTKVYERNPLTKLRENERLDYALTR